MVMTRSGADVDDEAVPQIRRVREFNVPTSAAARSATLTVHVPALFSPQ